MASLPLLAGCGGGSSGSLTQSWTTLAPVPELMSNDATAAVGGKIYSMAGCCPGTASTYRYDIASNSWTAKGVLAPVPATKFDPQIAAVGTDAGGTVNIYHIGGNNSGFCTNLNFAYNPATNTWTGKALMPTPRCHLAVVALNNLIYAIGGTNTSGDFDYNNVEVYDPATDSWTAVAPLPTGVSNVRAVVANGKIYVVAANTLGVFITKALIYDPVANTWKSSAAALPQRDFPYVGLIGSLIFLAGGTDSGGAFHAENFAYNPAADTWTQQRSMNVAESGGGSVVVGGILYAVGGCEANGSCGTVQAFNPR